MDKSYSRSQPSSILCSVHLIKDVESMLKCDMLQAAREHHRDHPLQALGQLGAKCQVTARRRTVVGRESWKAAHAQKGWTPYCNTLLDLFIFNL